MAYIAYFTGGPYDGRQEIRQGDVPGNYLMVEELAHLPATVPSADSPVQPKVTGFMYRIKSQHFDHRTQQWHARYVLK